MTSNAQIIATLSRRTLLFFILYFLFSPIGAQTMSDAISRMPDTVVPYLNENMRLDLIDFIQSGMKAEVTNNLGGKSVLRQLSDRYSSWQLNEAAGMEMRLLDTAEPVDSANQIICVVKTWGTDIQESSINFYSMEWLPLPAQRFIQLPDEACKMTISEASATLTLTPECKLDYPANEEQKDVTKPLIVYNWNGRTFKKN